ncbi:hypothetical protein GO003_012480 [Methylicorpusculum oleiharenae]|uniref:hypothetical protein n=1 Tax=Methylicorpusculum oleiharenae TaxID=1338687 RepID=UPI0013576ADA|nr:hypothetical protein [Methylicorpusculum oleiharenae]MCD2451209.1 hypothetical protein [Methylicorpusculum oleiharenae]
MQKQMRKNVIFSCLVLLMLLGENSSMASNEFANEGTVQSVSQWPMAMWYGLSVVLALIGYVSAKSRH